MPSTALKVRAGCVPGAETGNGYCSLDGLHASVPVPPPSASFWRHWRAFVGPAFLVGVGYMDPGNWGTDLEAGARFRYQLLWVVGLSSLMAMVMQVISARLGVVTGKNLAEACRDYYPAWTRLPNWILCEIAIVACDLAEVLGSAVAIHLLFPAIPLFWAVVITAFDVVVLLSLQGMGMRILEAIIVMLIATIGVCYYIELFILPPYRPNYLELGTALLSPGFHDKEMIAVAIGIIGATVMPHNLYLHSALVRTRKLRGDEAGIRQAIRFNTVDTVVALSMAFLINAAILVLAAMVFNQPGHEYPKDTDWITEAFQTLAPLLGTAAASTLFAVALLASGQSSTITGTLAGQVVMEGFMHWRLRPWLRRLATRLLAIIPAIFIIGLRSNISVTRLLVFTQVILALQLPFAMFPLLHFTSSKKWMGQYANGWFLRTLGWGSALLITALALYGLPELLPEAGEVITGR